MSAAEELIVNTPEEIASLDPALREMLDAGVFYGRKKSKTHPRMKAYILGTRNEIEVVNIAKTKEVFDEALAFLREKAKSGGRMLFVATQPAAEGVRALAHEFHFPAVTLRWLGGTLTNFKIISKRIEYFTKLKSDWAKNEFEKYTKKERVGIEREMRKLEELLGDLEPLQSIPDVMIVIDPALHTTAIREARRLQIPIVAFANTDSDPDLVTYPVVGNTKARMSIDWFFHKVREAIHEGMAQRAKMVEELAAKKAASEEKEKAE